MFYQLSLLASTVSRKMRHLRAFFLIHVSGYHPVPYDYPNLSNRTTTTSPFTIVFYQAGSSAFSFRTNSGKVLIVRSRCGRLVHEHRDSYLCPVCGEPCYVRWDAYVPFRCPPSIPSPDSPFSIKGVLYSLATSSPPLAPRIFGRTTRGGVPLLALLASSSISALCFGSSFIGSGELWGWLQNIVGVSNQVCPRLRSW